MKTFYLGVVLILGPLQAGCGIGGYSMTGMVLEDNAKPHLQYYEKQNWTSEARRQDSSECGGPPNESIQFGSNAIQAAQHPGETDRQTEMRLNQEWHACMTEKGYRDTRAATK